MNYTLREMLILFIFLLVVLLSLVMLPAYSQVCPGPSGCSPPTGPNELCLREHCSPVIYSPLGGIIIAESNVDGYSVIGWAGPCLKSSFAECPDILNQAFSDLEINAFRALRAMESR